MARYSKEDIRSGGFCKLWAQAWLEDENLKKAGQEIRGYFSCVLCAAQLVDWEHGIFHVAKIPLTLDQIASKSDLKPDHIQKLLNHGFLSNDNGLISVKNWRKWQSKSKGIEIPIKSEFNQNNNSTTNDGQMSDVRLQISDVRLTNGGDKSPKGFNGTNLTEEQYARKYKSTYQRLKADQEATSKALKTKSLEDDPF